MPSPTIWSICFVYCNCRKRGARYKSKLCASGSSKSALAFVKLRAAFGFISPRAGPGKPSSANSRLPSIPVSRLLRRQSVCLAPQGRSLLQKLSSSIAMQHFVLTVRCGSWFEMNLWVMDVYDLREARRVRLLNDRREDIKAWYAYVHCQ